MSLGFDNVAVTVADVLLAGDDPNANLDINFTNSSIHLGSDAAGNPLFGGFIGEGTAPPSFPAGAVDGGGSSIIYAADGTPVSDLSTLQWANQNAETTDVWSNNGIAANFVVPEPATLSLLALGALALGRRRR